MRPTASSSSLSFRSGGTEPGTRSPVSDSARSWSSAMRSASAVSRPSSSERAITSTAVAYEWSATDSGRPIPSFSTQPRRRTPFSRSAASRKPSTAGAPPLAITIMRGAGERAMPVYTRTGDDGTTGLRGGARISKSSPRVAAYGAVDEANAAVGLARAASGGRASGVLLRAQDGLFRVGADLSDPSLSDPMVSGSMADSLEPVIDGYESALPPLSKFVLPGGTELAARLHAARAAVRRAESAAVGAGAPPACTAYLNRLSDLLFVMARDANGPGGDVEWDGRTVFT